LQLKEVLDQMIGGSLVERKLEEVHGSIQADGCVKLNVIMASLKDTLLDPQNAV